MTKGGMGFDYNWILFKHMDEFRRYERGARENKRGLWGE